MLSVYIHPAGGRRKKASNQEGSKLDACRKFERYCNGREGIDFGGELNKLLTLVFFVESPSLFPACYFRVYFLSVEDRREL